MHTVANVSCSLVDRRDDEVDDPADHAVALTDVDVPVAVFLVQRGVEPVERDDRCCMSRAASTGSAWMRMLRRLGLGVIRPSSGDVPVPVVLERSHDPAR